MEMKKIFEVNPELEEMREQFRMLTEKVDKQNIVTDQLMREVSKKKIHRFEFWAYWIFYIAGSMAAIWGIVSIFLEGHPLWTSFSFVYMLLLLVILAILRMIKNHKYFSRINYDLTTYLKDEESSGNRKTSVKAACIIVLIFAPIFIHGVFLFDYLISVQYLGGQLWPYTIVLILAAFLGVALNNKYRRMIFRLFWSHIFD